MSCRGRIIVENPSLQELVMMRTIAINGSRPRHRPIFRSNPSLLLLFGFVLCMKSSFALTQQTTEAQEAQEEVVAPDTRLDRSLEYTIQPGDVIRVMVWREPELTSDYVVRLDGQVTLPLLGDIPASGRSPDELSAQIQESLKAFLERPIVAVAIVQANSARFFVIGQVARSGSYPMFGRTTVLQALALAGGFREFAKRDRILIIRQTGQKQETIPFNYKALEDGKDLETNVALVPGDTILVP
jgi:polysaccharide export outer membrane protein